MLQPLLPYIFAALAGIAFAYWPIPTGASLVPGGTTAFIMAGITMILMMPVIYLQGGWPAMTPKAFGLVSLGGTIQTVGIISMVMLALLTWKAGTFPDFFVLCLVVQVCAAASLKISSGGFTVRHAIGFVAAAVVAIAMGKGG